MRNPTRSIAAVVAGLTTLATVPAWAQSQSNGQGEGEIVVTAQRRAQGLIEIPVAVTAFSGAALESGELSSLTDLSGLAPGLSAQSLSPTSGRFYVRGIGTDDFSIGGDSSVAIFVDDVYVGRSEAALLNLDDLERVEVLRGPQGTLFGRNTIGGVINVVTHKPSDEIEASARVRYERFDTWNLDGLVNVPLSDQFAVRAVLSFGEQGGYVDNPALQRDQHGGRSLFGRVSARWEPNANLTVDLSADYTDMRADFVAQRLTGYVEPLAIRDALQGLFGVDVAAAASQPYGTSGGDDPRTFEARDVWGTSLNAQYERGNYTFASVTAYREFQYDQFQDEDGSFIPALSAGTNSANAQLSQEFRIIRDGERLTWQVGASVFDEEITQDTRADFGFPLFAIIAGSIESALPPSLIPPGALSISPGERYVETTRAKGDYLSIGLFADGSFDLTDRLTIGAGVRLSRDEKAMVIATPGNPETGFLAGFGAPFPVFLPTQSTQEDSFEDVSARIVAQYAFSPDLRSYISFTQGYKPGGFNSTNPDRPFDAENVDSYEIGLRGDLANGDLTFSLAAFQYAYEGLQVNRIVGTQVVIENAEVETTGLEVELGLRPTAGLRFMANATLLDSEFTRYGAGAVSFTGNQVPEAPEFAGAASAEYERAFGALTLGLRGEYVYKSDFYFEPDNNLQDRQAGYGLLNLRAALLGPEERWELALFGRNVTDEQYQLRRRSVAYDLGFRAVLDAPPASYGASFLVRW